ncbi:pilin accessory protein PilO [Enterobacter cloacae]|uniref:Pilin accessory protein PilO n=1 Tax=Enterobacter cloacae TaxID=550 RepID=A0A377MB65_ENTCL|nr:pilin accessory protein PilO [Enterobacter cloacae]
MRFISHLQRRNLDVKFTEVKPPAVAPGQEKNTPVQDWRNSPSPSARVCSLSACCRILMPPGFA